MCLAIPAKVTALLDNERAMVNVGGIQKEISTALLETVQEGDYVIIHVGFALTRLDEQEAKKTLNLFSDLLKQEVPL
jgi:hydrogenase expression/formation protein HypC